MWFSQHFADSPATDRLRRPFFWEMTRAGTIPQIGGQLDRLRVVDRCDDEGQGLDGGHEGEL